MSLTAETRSRKRTVLAATVVGVLYLAFQAWVTYVNPLVRCPLRLIEEDHYILFSVVDRILMGGQLYTDVAYYYGPLSVYPYVWIAAAFGNSVSIQWAHAISLAALNAGLLWTLLRRHLGGALASAFTAVLTFASQWGGGPPWGVVSSPYTPIEFSLFLLVALVWAPPAGRSARRSLLLGAIAACLQAAKFGSGVMALGALIGIDLLSAWAHGIRWRDRALLQPTAQLVAAWVVTVAAYAGFIFCWLPNQRATEVLWPAYLAEPYAASDAAAGTFRNYFDHFEPKRFVRLELPLLLALTSIVLYVRRELRRPEALPAMQLLLFPLAFVVGSVLLFKHIYLWYQYERFFALGLALGLTRASSGRWVRRTALLGLILLGIAATIDTGRTLLRRPRDQVALRTPSGEILWGPPEQSRSYGEWLARAREFGKTAVIGGIGRSPLVPGFVSFAGAGLLTRHTWVAPGLIRPEERRAIIDLLLTSPFFISIPRDRPQASLAEALAAVGVFNAEESAELLSSLCEVRRFGSLAIEVSPCPRPRETSGP